MKKLDSARVLLATACVASAALLVIVSETGARAAAPGSKYGIVTGQFILDGAIPDLPPIVKAGEAVRDAAVCAKEEVPNEELVIDPKSKGIANIFVYIRKPKNVPAEFKKSDKPYVEFDQKGCRFIPHALIVRTDQTVKVLSGDPVAHNTHTHPIRNQAVNTAIKPNDREGLPFKKPIAESLPMRVTCDFHPWMKAYWLVLDHPYAAVTDEEGRFTIENLPPGEHEFVVWHERAGYVNRKLTVKVEAGKTTDLKTQSVPASKFN